MRLPYEVRIALRGLRPKNRGPGTFNAFLACFGIAAGTASLIFVLALARGFREEIEKGILTNTPHIAIFSPDKGRIDDWRSAIQRTSETDGVDHASAALSVQSLAQNENLSAFAEIICDDIQSAEGDGDKASSADVGIELAKRLNVKKGGQIHVSIVGEDGAPVRTEFVVRSIVTTGIYDLDDRLIKVSASSLRTIFGTNKIRPNFIKVSVGDLDNTESVKSRLSEALNGSGLKLLTWSEANQPLFRALAQERIAATTFLSVILLLATLNISASISSNVNARKIEIAIMRTSGASAGTIARIFLFQGLTLAIIGAFFGTMVGLLVCYLVDGSGMLRLPPEIYSVSYVKLLPQWYDSATVTGVVLAVSVIAASLPAIQASRLRPAETLRNA